MRKSQIVKIKQWLRNNDFECDVKIDPYFSYSISKDCIYISDELNECDHLDNYIKYIKHLGYNKNLNPKTIAFLHELGHAETMNDLPEIDFVIDKLKTIVETPCASKFTLDLKSNIYYRLPVERKATEWAVNFINTYYNSVYELDLLLNGE